MAKAKKPADGRSDWVGTAEAARADRRAIKTGIYLSEDGSRRLKTAKLVLGMDYSLIIDALLRHYLVGFYSGWRTGEDKEDVPAAQAEAA